MDAISNRNMDSHNIWLALAFAGTESAACAGRLPCPACATIDFNAAMQVGYKQLLKNCL